MTMLSGLENTRLSGLRHGYDHFTGELLGNRLDLVDDFPFQDAQQVVNGDVVNIRVGNCPHGIARNVSGSQHSVELSVAVNNRQNGNAAGVGQRVPCTADGYRVVQGRRGIVVQVADLSSNVGEQHRRLHIEFFQDGIGLIADVSEPCGDIVPVTERVPQRRVGDGGDNGVGVGVAVSRNVDRIHNFTHFS